MTEADRERLFGWRHALDHPVTLGALAAMAVVFAVTPVVAALLARSGRVTLKLKGELDSRYRSWLVIVPLMFVPVLAGAFWTILAAGVLGLACHREFARATGLARERLISLTVVAGIVAATLAALDDWYRLFVALWPLTAGVICGGSILQDRPQGYLHRVGLGVLSFTLFGVCLGHLGWFANDAGYRPVLVLLLVAVELNDIFAFIVGKSLGRRKILPNTSPNKTVAGSAGALLLTTTLVAAVGHFVFRGGPVDRPGRLLLLGVMVSGLGQLGDLLLSSVKRDVGIKDMGAVFPGHGGVLDRFNSLILAAPAVFHYLAWCAGPPQGILARR